MDSLFQFPALPHISFNASSSGDCDFPRDLNGSVNFMASSLPLRTAVQWMARVTDKALRNEQTGSRG